MRRMVNTVAGMVLGVALVARCGTNPNPTVGMMDGGLIDGLMIDGISNANADTSTVMKVACDKVATRTVTKGTYKSVADSYYADIDTGIDVTNSPHVTTTLCDREQFGIVPSSCPAGYTCTDSGFTLPTYCVQANALIAGTHVLIGCGGRTKTTDTAYPSTNSDTGSRYNTVYVRIN